MSEETRGQSKILVRGLSILNARSSSRSGLTLVEIADVTDLASSTVHRLLATLEAQAFFPSIKKLVTGELVFLVFGWVMPLCDREIMLRNLDH